MSIFVIHIRKRAFEKRFGDVLRAQEGERRRRRETIRDTSQRSFSTRRSFAFHRSPTREGETVGVTGKPIPGRPQSLNDPRVGDSQIDTVISSSPSEHPEADGTVESSHASKEANEPTGTEKTTTSTNRGGPDHISFVRSTPIGSLDRIPRPKRRGSAFSFEGVGASPVTTSFRRPGSSRLTDRRPPNSNPSCEVTNDHSSHWHIGGLLRKEVVGRNSQFHGLTHEERDRLGGVEYRAITLLSWVVPIYFILWQLLGCLSVGAWMANYASDITEANGINAWYYSSSPLASTYIYLIRPKH